MKHEVIAVTVDNALNSYVVTESWASDSGLIVCLNKLHKLVYMFIPKHKVVRGSSDTGSYLILQKYYEIL